MNYSKSLKSLYLKVKDSILEESTILMQGDEPTDEVHEYNVSKDILKKIKRILDADKNKDGSAKPESQTLLEYLVNTKQINEAAAEVICLYVENYSTDAEHVTNFILSEEQKPTLLEVSNSDVSIVDILERKGFNSKLTKALLKFKDQGVGPGEYLFSVAIQNIRKKGAPKKLKGSKPSKKTKESSDNTIPSNIADKTPDKGGDIELIEGGVAKKIELKGNSGILRPGKQHVFGSPKDCSTFWREELLKKLTVYGMLTDIEELPDATGTPLNNKLTGYSFKLNRSNKITVDVFGKKIIERLKYLKEQRKQFKKEEDYANWLSEQNVKLTSVQLSNETFELKDLYELWAKGFQKLFIKESLNDIIMFVKNAYTNASPDQSDLGICLRNALMVFNLKCYLKIDNFDYFVLFDHILESSTFGRTVCISKEDLETHSDEYFTKKISVLCAPDFSRDVVSSSATSIKINSSNIQSE
jgi:hypothetical protein